MYLLNISILKVYLTISMTLFYTIKCIILCKKTFYLEILTLYKVVCININIHYKINFFQYVYNKYFRHNQTSWTENFQNLEE